MTEPISNNLKYLEENYKPSDIQKLLDSGRTLKGAICVELGVSYNVLNHYMKRHNLVYMSKVKLKVIEREKRQARIKNTQKISVDNSIYQERTDALEKFYEMLAKKRAKRMLKELLDPYGD
jgi:hypothetical protein